MTNYYIQGVFLIFRDNPVTKRAFWNFLKTDIRCEVSFRSDLCQNRTIHYFGIIGTEQITDNRQSGMF